MERKTLALGMIGVAMALYMLGMFLGGFTTKQFLGIVLIVWGYQVSIYKIPN